MNSPLSQIRTILCSTLAALTLVATTHGDDPRPAAAAADLRPTSKAPTAWRTNQIQRRSVDRAPIIGDAAVLANATPVIMAGSTVDLPPDAPVRRIDDNSLFSSYRGVCSLQLNGTGLCTGTAIGPRHILTAAHCLDFNDDGVVDVTSVQVTFNTAGDASYVVPPSQVAAAVIHPDYTGFANPSLNDDIALIILNTDLPPEILTYPLFRGELNSAETITLVGYGDSGNGAVGPTINANQTIKRIGFNDADEFFNDDEATSNLEVFRADFDAPDGGSNCLGGTSLGNRLETTAAPGDSGGPAFVEVDKQLHVWGVNTFIDSCTGTAGSFGGVTGGTIVNAYLPWIDSMIECAGNCNDCNENGIPDGMDILSGPSDDGNQNGVPDECDVMTTGDLWVAESNGLVGYSFAAGSTVTTDDNALFSFLGLSFLNNDGLMYVAGRTSPFTSGVYRVDATTGAFAGTMIDESEGIDTPTDLTLGADGLLYVLNSGTNNGLGITVSRHNPYTGAFIDYFVQDDPNTPESENGNLTSVRSFTFGPDGTLYIPDMSTSNGIPSFDGTTGESLGLFGEIPTSIGGLGDMRFHGGYAYVSQIFGGNILKLDASTGAFVETLIDLDMANIFDFIFAEDGLLYLLIGSGQARLDRFDPETGAFVDSFLDSSQLNGAQTMIFMPKTVPPSADINGDGQVGIDDLIAVIVAWGDCPMGLCPADVTGNGSVNVDDLVQVILQWG